jgi:flagellar biosynthesis chaperone FliJ
VKELKKLNKHMGAIEGKVTELHKQYNELKEVTGANQQKVLEAPALADVRDPTTASKINKFAAMLKTLSAYKNEYKIASSAEAKSEVHKKVMDFTRKWLDTKNLQLSDNIHA